MLGFDVQLKGFNRLDEVSQRLIVPLRQAAVTLAASIRKRVQAGVSPRGGMWTPLGEYTTTGRSKDEKNKWWVAPNQPQPAGYMRKVQQGQWQGWAVYENYKSYLDLLPHGRRRDWEKTGSLWRSYGVRAMGVSRVKISFYGSKGRGNAQAAIATLAGRMEGASVLQYNEPERQAFVADIKATIDEEFAKRIGEVTEAQRLTRRARSASRRSSVLLGG
ncbi:MAG: hypothetical protein FJ271_34220 [Planctomycetes bacterium]|nr:hypothetical protein [Planctomycetota bacterium]